MRLTRLRPPALALATSALVLTGCGVAGTNFQPGVAASVGDQSISVNRVDALVSSYCSAVEERLADGNQVVPLNYFRSGVAGTLALRAAAEQVAEMYGVAPSATYTSAVSQITGAVTSLPADQQEAVIEIETATQYVSDITDAIGRRQLTDAGEADPGLEDATARGEQALASWIQDNDVEFDPRFGLEVRDGAVVPVDTSVSYPVSDTATLGAAEAPDPTYAVALPDASRCG